MGEGQSGWQEFVVILGEDQRVSVAPKYRHRTFGCATRLPGEAEFFAVVGFDDEHGFSFGFCV